MHQQANVGKLADRRHDHLLNLMYDRAQEVGYLDLTARITRQGDAALLQVPRPRTHKLEVAPKYMGSVKWNELPVKLRGTSTKLHFKHAYTAYKLTLTALQQQN